MPDTNNFIKMISRKILEWAMTEIKKFLIECKKEIQINGVYQFQNS